MLWNVYDFAGNLSSLSIENDSEKVELSLPGPVIENFKSIEEKIGLGTYFKKGINPVIKSSLDDIDLSIKLNRILQSGKYRLVSF